MLTKEQYKKLLKPFYPYTQSDSERIGNLEEKLQILIEELTLEKMKECEETPQKKTPT